MKKLLLFILLTSIAASAQLQRYDNFAATTTSASGIGNLTQVIPNATLTVFNYPGAGVNCAGGGCVAATTYTSRTGATACGGGLPLTRPTSNTCLSTADSQGNFGFWAATGNYQYCVAATNFTTQCYNVVLGPAFDATNVQYANQFTGSDVCVQITNAIAALPSTGGIVDARAFQGAQTACAGTFSVGSGTKPVTLLLGASQITVQNTITIFNQSAIVGIGENGSLAASILFAGSSFPASTPIVKFDSSQITLNARLIGVGLYCNTVSGCIGLDMGKAEDSTEVNHIMVYKYLGNCINFSNTASQLGGIYNVQCYADSTATGTTAINMPMANNSDAIKLSRISIVPLSASQQTAGISCNSCNMIVDEVHIEQTVDGILIQGASGSATVSEINCITSVTTCVHISSTTGFGVSAFGIRKFGATNSLKNDIGFFSLTCTDESLPYYIFSALSLTEVSACNSSNSGQIFIGETNVAVRSNLTERGAVGGVAGVDVCAGNSTAHAIQCSYNNGTFFNQTQTIANGTATLTTAAITAGNCGTTVTVAAANVATTDTITWAFNAAPAGSNAGLVAWPTSGNVNFAYCPNTAETPAAATANWRVIR